MPEVTLRDLIVGRLGEPRSIDTPDGNSPELWTTDSLDIILMDSEASDAQLKRGFAARSIGETPVVVVSRDADGTERTVGPQAPVGPPRRINTTALDLAIATATGRPRRLAAAYLEGELSLLEGATIPGVVFNGLLTAHTLLRRVREGGEDNSELAVAGSSVNAGAAWRENILALGFEVEQTRDSYLLRHNGQPVAVLQPHSDDTSFGGFDSGLTLPGGQLLAECRREGVTWGILATNRRWRLYYYALPTGSALANYLEVDLEYLPQDSGQFLGLFSPYALATFDGEPSRFERWMTESAQYGESLKGNIERQLRQEALPSLANGIAQHLVLDEGLDLGSPYVRHEIQLASLTLLFRILFLRFAESAEYLPMRTPEYSTRSITALAQESLVTGVSGGSSPTLWEGLTTLFRMVRKGDPARSVPAYNGSLFSPKGFPGASMLERVTMSDQHLSKALRAVSYYSEGSFERGIDYADLGVSHLGSIYEGLIALRLSWTEEDLTFHDRRDRFEPVGPSTDVAVPAHELFFQSEKGGRKSGGVFYTRQEFVRHLLSNSLVPALDQHLEMIESLADTDPGRAADELFDFKVVDPAMGSGHFLIDALNILADKFAESRVIRLPQVRVELDELRRDAMIGSSLIRDEDLLRRLIVKRCIYGVDLSEMAVEVANISMWLASFVPGLSLAYLGSNLKVGDALTGIASWDTLDSLGPMFSPTSPNSPLGSALSEAEALRDQLSSIQDRTPEEVEQSRVLDEQFGWTLGGVRLCLDLWTAEPFVQQERRIRQAGANGFGETTAIAGPRDILRVDSTVQRLMGRGESTNVRERQAVEASKNHAVNRRFFHWPIEFPDVFFRDRPGFDVVVGNPPWNKIKAERREFYGLHDPGLRGISSASERERRIQRLLVDHPELEVEFEELRERLETQRLFFSAVGGYEAQGSGDPDLYKLFCERYRHLCRSGGRLGIVLPRGALFLEGALPFRQWLFTECTVTRVDFLLNTGRWAFDMEARYTIVLLSATRESPMDSDVLMSTGPSASLAQFQDAIKSPNIEIPLTTLARWSQSTDGSDESLPSWEVPLVGSSRAVEILNNLRNGPSFKDGYPGLIRVFPVRELDESNDKKLFQYSSGIPVWKRRSFDPYKPHGDEPVGYAELEELGKHLQRKRLSPQGQFRKHFDQITLANKESLPLFNARVAYARHARATDSRSVLACLIPPNTALVDGVPYFVPIDGSQHGTALLLGILNSVVFDWQARRYIETDLNYFALDLLALPPLKNLDSDRVAMLATRLSSVDDRFIEFADAVGVKHGVIPTDESDAMLAEIDALVAIAYGVTRDDLKFIFQDFPKTDAGVSETYRTRVLGKYTDLTA